MHIDSGIDRPNMAGEGPLHPIEPERRAYLLGSAMIIGWVVAVTGVVWFGLIAAGVIH